MKRVIFALLALSLAASPVWAGGLTLTIHDGKVSLDAQEVTVREILTEWARVGKTRIVNLERVSSAPVTLKFDDVPEQQALDTILRSVPGYMAAPRAEAVKNASMYDRILIMATTVAVPPRPASSPFPTSPYQAYQPPSGVTQLRAPQPMMPGVLPEPPSGPGANETGPDLTDPAIAAAAAAGLIAIPAPSPSYIDPVLRAPGPSRVPLRTPATGAIPAPATPTPIFTAPAGTAQPGLPTPAPATSPARPASIAPPQPDR